MAQGEHSNMEPETIRHDHASAGNDIGAKLERAHMASENFPSETTIPTLSVSIDRKKANHVWKDANSAEYLKETTNTATNCAKASNNKIAIQNRAAKFGALKVDAPPVARKKRLSAVHKKKLAFERLAKEESRKSNPQVYLTTSWKAKHTYGQYQKSTTDSRGVAPKKSLADLP
mmetsp:Transcript_54041/g.65238  ORF Transcript_54041/g.65238 Transcript_54041/m.65238 type:complete len:174 (-) Transcript_54041:235-756(-)|eukprot:CAMPEP_0172494148 /NCGR_PEP_ID=MMETSP1066-20121228/39636_1 /TAXON_ID=671091 /ORGANISM="Coscinodiscus wailesii, Strain CCMP2513" /LENGTH=173 /DNA_ID=CAMNT_0013264873 /DNA_START=87 /DNA_END=608 /DNA_ORIENTATION=+